MYRNTIKWDSSCDESDTYPSRQEIFDTITTLKAENTSQTVYQKGNSYATTALAAIGLIAVFAYFYENLKADEDRKVRYSLMLIALLMLVAMILLSIQISDLNSALEPLETRQEQYKTLDSIKTCSS